VTLESRTSLPDRVRAACAWVAADAELVRIDQGAIEEYAAELSATAARAADRDSLAEPLLGDREGRAAFVICLDAINFGSGWWPTIRKRPGLSGYSTIAAGVRGRFRDAGGWTAADLSRIDATEVAVVVGQDPAHPLMPQFAAALRDVGTHVLDDHGGRFEAVVDAGKGSAIEVATLLASWQAFADVSLYREREVPFFKRAQLAAADLDRGGIVAFPDCHRLTAFADNLVPHVLRVDRVIHLDQDLKDAIEAEELLDHGSAGEVELRACAVHAIEMLSAATAGRLSPAGIDAALWNRGREPRYKALPRPRSRNTAY
jgi:Potential Queuosine, Q, salvage protein family